MAETIGRYELLERIGAGTLGELHRARDLQHGRTVALRLVSPAITQDDERLTALLKDVDRVSALSHPAVPALYEDGQDGERVYIASEYVAGQSLAEMVHATPINPRRALDLAVQVADGLAAAHASGLEHGALSTRRIIVTPKSAVKILDVGMLAWTGVAASEHVSDFVGLGEVLFEMLVGRPIRRGWPAELKVDQLPQVVRPVLRKLLSSDPKEQYGDMALASAALREAMEQLGGATQAVPVPTRTPARSTSSRTYILAALLLVLLVVAVWLLSRSL
ncbi:MAG: protein kinase [Acidobacteria bacterium]|nr:protein kinase [Acidobacteriota bacterium]